MKIFHFNADLIENISLFKKEEKTVGFVPTMGSLHQGHLSLIRLAMKNCDIVVCSIFVNPTQFNDPGDFNSYPKHEEKDIALLKSEGCEIVFIPKVSEVYPDGLVHNDFPLKQLGNVLEGAFRPGHFNGVIQVVKRLFEIVSPDKAYFGIKDFQQLAVIRWMVEYYKIPIEIIGGSIIRDKSGLALSSRNERLSNDEKESALKLSKSLFYIEENYKNETFSVLRTNVLSELKKDPAIEVEYLEMANSKDLAILNSIDEALSVGVFIAAKIGDVRLIDNIILF